MLLVVAGYLGITAKENHEIRETEIVVLRFRFCLAKGAKKGYNTRQGNENNIYILLRISEDGIK